MPPRIDANSSLQRNPYFDFLRGVAILMVVGIHTAGRHCGFDTYASQFNTIVRQLLNAGVPIFFAISGFFLIKKDLSTSEKRIAFWKRQIPKVYIPALIWGIPWLLLALYSGGQPIILQFILWLCCGLSVFYFIAVTIQNYILLPLIQKMPPPTRIIVASVLSFVSIFIITWVRAYKGINLPLIVYAGNFPLWILFFVIGTVLSGAKRNCSIIVLLLLLIISVAAQYFEALLIEKIGGAGFGIKPSSFIYSVVLIMLLFSKKLEDVCNFDNIIFRSITWFGEISFGIYLTHYLVIFFLNLLPYNHLWIVDWILTFSIDVSFIFVLKRIVPQRFYMILGL